MYFPQKIIASVFVALVTSWLALAVSSPVTNVRQDAWRTLLEGGQYRIPEYYSGLLRSLGEFDAEEIKGVKEIKGVRNQ